MAGPVKISQLGEHLLPGIEGHEDRPGGDLRSGAHGFGLGFKLGRVEPADSDNVEEDPPVVVVELLKGATWGIKGENLG